LCVGETMREMVTVKLAGRFEGVEILDAYGGRDVSVGSAGNRVGAQGRLQSSAESQLESQREALRQVCGSLQQVVDRLGEYVEQLFGGYRQDVVKLSVAIADKILARRVEQGDYDIEAIVGQALQETGCSEEVVVHLHPADMERLKDFVQGRDEFRGISFLADSQVGAGECVVESPGAVIESLIDRHLERVAEALKKVG